MEETIDYIMAEDEKYAHLKKYEKKVKEAENIMHNLDLTHMEVYAAAAKDVLKVEKDNVKDIRQTDLSKLKEGKNQIALADKMADMYKDKAKEYFSRAKGNAGDKWDLDEFDESLLVQAVYGTTRSQLKELISDQKDGFSPNKFMQLKERMMERTKSNLISAAGHHLNKDHIEDIVKYTKIDKYDVDSSRLQLNDAIDYLTEYIKTGSVAPKNIKDLHKKPKKKAA